MAENIGTGRCPCCGSGKARFTLSKSGLAVITCNTCNFQGFARSGTSDEHLRGLIQQAAPAAPAATAAPAPAPAPEETEQSPGLKASAELASQQPKQAKRAGWGIFGGMA